MKRNVLAVLALAATLATAISFTSAFAASHTEDNSDHAAMGGLGFRSSEAPIGVRWWFSKQVALDAGVGFTSEKLNYSDINGDPANESLTSFSVDLGVPFALKTWDKVHFLLRPGFTYTSADDIDLFIGTDGEFKEKRNTFSVTGEFELEVFLAKNASISASHGAGFASTKLDIDGQESDTIFGTFGSNFTTLGFHVYLWQ